MSGTTNSANVYGGGNKDNCTIRVSEEQGRLKRLVEWILTPAGCPTVLAEDRYCVTSLPLGH